ncbi:hypothetical protein C8Q77DRAFT_325547 [Trametes polyzona]|nr:hypothetical protein C8Q77DRAFT_325547 [Trametes polyzona]
MSPCSFSLRVWIALITSCEGGLVDSQTLLEKVFAPFSPTNHLFYGNKIPWYVSAGFIGVIIGIHLHSSLRLRPLSI